MAHDERVYPEPESFKPERFLTTNGELTNDEVEYPFGFGRRQVFDISAVDLTLTSSLNLSGLAQGGFSRLIWYVRVTIRSYFEAHERRQQLWLTTASIIATFDILPKKDASGNDIPMPAGMDDNGLVQ